MGKTDGNRTKQQILKTAEILFSKEGYDGTSVNKIAEKAGVNKGVIYYHFKNKEDILNQLFKLFTGEVADLVNNSLKVIHGSNHSTDVFMKNMEGMIRFLEKRKGLHRISLMESLKKSNEDYSFLKSAEIIMSNDEDGIMNKKTRDKHGHDTNIQELRVFEFFTGFIPIVIFPLFRKKWSEYFDYSIAELNESFFKAFKYTHLAHHFLGQRNE